MSAETPAPKRPRVDGDVDNDDLATWSRERLEEEVRRLRATRAPMRLAPTESTRPVKPPRPFDMSKYHVRPIALKVAYFGWDYNGLEAQENTEKTIETQVFAALKTARLVIDRDSCNYSRCGRTDKGVSAFSQVLALKVRSNALTDKPIPPPEEELDYPTILNRLLPQDIRVVAWSPVTETFSARFHCASRMYKYFIPTHGLDVERMREAGQLFVGTHDFINLCKINKTQETNYIRTVHSVALEPLAATAALDERFRMHVLTVHGKGFLWHQIRHMVAVLMFVGTGVEKPDVISRLLDTSIARPRPHYEMASELPLVLYECEFPDVQFIYNKDVLSRVSRSVTEQYIEWGTKAFMSLALLDQLDRAVTRAPDGSPISWGALRTSPHAPIIRKPKHMPIP